VPTPNPLRDHFVRAARDTARAAIDKVGATEPLDVNTAAFHAGQSIEFMLRAVVASIGPGLLFVSRNGNSKANEAMVKAQLVPTLDLEWLATQKTADASAVREMVATALPSLNDHKKGLDALVRARDGATHAYSAEGDDLRAKAAVLARVGAVLLEYLGEEPRDFWGQDRLDLVNALTEEQAQATRAAVALKVHEARVRFERVTDGLNVIDRAVVLGRLESSGTPLGAAGFAKMHADCPACERRAQLWIRAEDLFWSLEELELADLDNDGVVEHVLVPQVTVDARLICAVCNLHLTATEIEAEYPDLADLTMNHLEPRVAPIDEYSTLAQPYMDH
jgi:hypothetical protein